MQINFPICKFLSVPEFYNATGENTLGAKPNCVCVCVCAHRHSLSSASGKWWCRMFTKIIWSFWIDLFDMQQSFIATASLPTYKIMVTNKMCDSRLIVKIYMWSGGKPTRRGSWRRETLCMQIKKSTPFTPLAALKSWVLSVTLRTHHTAGCIHCCGSRIQCPSWKPVSLTQHPPQIK